ncbi:MAG TPA: hypothetical protein V6D47_17485 [Oscillatoriaceae cyanobacterium]
MTEYLEKLIRAALHPPLAQALVMVYCRHVCEPEIRAHLRRLVAHEPELLKQFDSLDELHAEFPFGQLSRLSLDEELKLLYWHNRQLRESEMLTEIRRLCWNNASLLGEFDRLDKGP